MKSKLNLRHAGAPPDSLQPAGSAFRLNTISGDQYPLPRIMWADCDEDDKHTPVAIYSTKAEQRGNRPELKAVPVVVIPLADADTMHTHLSNAIQAAKERGIKTPNSDSATGG